MGDSPGGRRILGVDRDVFTAAMGPWHHDQAARGNRVGLAPVRRHGAAACLRLAVRNLSRALGSSVGHEFTFAKYHYLHPAPPLLRCLLPCRRPERRWGNDGGADSTVTDAGNSEGLVSPSQGQTPSSEDHAMAGAKGIAVLPLFPIFRQFFHFHENPSSSSVISGTFSRENRFPQKRQKRPKIAKHTKHEPLPKRDAIFATFP